MDELDKMISKIVNQKVLEPSSYQQIIKKSLENYKGIKYTEILKKAAIIVLSISTIGCVVFAKQLNNLFNKNIDNNEDSQYIQKLNNEYKMRDNLSIKMDSIVVDDFKVQLDINYLYIEPITSAESKIMIKDENNTILFSNYDIEIENYFENRFRKEDRHKYGESIIKQDKTNRTKDNTLIQTTARFNSYYKNIENNNISRTLELYTDLDLKKFPESKMIYIQIEDVLLRNGSSIIKKLENKWDFEIPLDKKFLNRNTNTYIQNCKNNSDFRIVAAEVSNVQLKIKIEYQGSNELKNLIDTLNLESIQIFDEKKNRYMNAQMIDIVENNIIKVDYNSDRNDLSDSLKVKIGDFEEIEIIKYVNSEPSL